jgi:hypothetical protein
MIAWFASFMLRFWIHGLIFWSAASCNISLISSGDPMAEPPTLMPLAMSVKALMAGRFPPSGALRRR